MKFKIINRNNQLGTPLETYGSGVYISSLVGRIAIFIYALLPLFSAWAFPLIPKIKGFWIRY